MMHFKTIIKRMIVGATILLHAQMALAGSLSIPCTDNAASASVDPSLTGLRSCALVREATLSAVKKRIQKDVNDYYLEVSCSRAGAHPGCMETCDIYPGEFNNGLQEGIDDSNNKNNHLGIACGNWKKMVAKKVPPQTCEVSAVAATGPSREDALARGIWVRALNCAYASVRNEINAGSLALTSVGDAPGPCAAMSVDFDVKKRTSDQLAKEMLKSLQGQSNIGDIEHCTESETIDTKSGAPGPGRLRQSACQLMASRQVVETLFTHLAVCEVTSRARLSQNQFNASVLGNEDLQKVLRDEMNNGGKKACNVKPGECVDAAAGLSSCYQGAYLGKHKLKIEKIWPAGSCN